MEEPKQPKDMWRYDITRAIGAHSVYLAAKKDKKIPRLIDDGLKSKQSIANVMVYMAAQYKQHLTSDEVEMGLLAATSMTQASKKRKKSGPKFDALGREYADKLSKLLTADDIGSEIKDIIDRFNMYDPTKSSYRTVEQGLGAAMRILGWDYTRRMTAGVRRYRWYPPEGYFDEPEPLEDEDAVFDDSSMDEVFDDGWADDIADEGPVEVAPVKKKRRSGVKPDEALAERIRTMNLFDGITSYEIALNSYDFVGNDLDVPKSEEDMTHKVKLSIGATMKAMNWKKRTRRVEGIPTVGWYSPSDWDVEPAIESVVLRKAEPVVEEPEPEPELADTLPRLAEPEDDLPWPDMSEFSGDDEAEEEFEKKIFVKMVNIDEGTEDVVERVIVMKNAGTYLLGTPEDPQERLLEFDPVEEIWVCKMGSAEE